MLIFIYNKIFCSYSNYSVHTAIPKNCFISQIYEHIPIIHWISHDISQSYHRHKCIIQSACSNVNIHSNHITDLKCIIQSACSNVNLSQTSNALSNQLAATWLYQQTRSQSSWDSLLSNHGLWRYKILLWRFKCYQNRFLEASIKFIKNIWKGVQHKGLHGQVNTVHKSTDLSREWMITSCSLYRQTVIWKEKSSIITCKDK